MPRSLSPIDWMLGMPGQVQKWAQSIHQIVNGGIALGQPISKNLAGVYNQFSTDNTAGTLIRIGASGTTEQQYVWTTSNTPILINHNLVDMQNNPRQPMGFHVVDSDGDVRVYRTVTPTTTQISLAPTDATKNVTLYIF